MFIKKAKFTRIINFKFPLNQITDDDDNKPCDVSLLAPCDVDLVGKKVHKKRTQTEPGFPTHTDPSMIVEKEPPAYGSENCLNAAILKKASVPPNSEANLATSTTDQVQVLSPENKQPVEPKLPGNKE